jgi:hypothetical protein
MADSVCHKKHFEERRGALKLEQSSFLTHWRELSEWIQPRRGRFLVGDVNKGDKRNAKIIDGSATMALRTLSSGMMAGITSPARPWFRLSTPDREMMEYGPVKIWLAQVEEQMREVFNQSNLYQALPSLYSELGLVATSALSVVEDFNDVIRVYPHTIGSYMIANSDRLEVDTLYREFQMTVGQVVGKFVYDGNRHGPADWERVSPAVKSLWDKGNVDTWIPVVHAIEPNDDRDLRLKDSKNKRVRSVHYEVGQSDDRLLSEKGFDEFPAMVPRWDVTGEDVYGTDCPGMTALGDVKALQIEQKRKAQAIDRMSNPPVTGPGSLRNVPVSVLPGGSTFHGDGAAKDGLRPVYQVDPRVRELMEDIRETKGRIDTAFYADLFLMLANSDRREITAREIDERHEEKLLMLGPVLERLHGELLNPLIDRTFAIMVRAGILPPAPKELEGTPLKVEYISILAQAQRAVGTASIERFANYIGGLAAVNPDVLDKFDMDQSADDYADMIGISPKLVRADDKVAEIRAQRAKQQQAQMAASMIQPAADAVGKLAGAKMDGTDALSKITGIS